MKPYKIEYDVLVTTLQGDILPREPRVETFEDAPSFMARLRELHEKSPKQCGCFIEEYENIVTYGDDTLLEDTVSE